MAETTDVTDSNPAQPLEQDRAEMEEAARQAQATYKARGLGLLTWVFIGLALDKALWGLLTPFPTVFALVWLYLAWLVESQRRDAAAMRAALRLSHLDHTKLSLLIALLDHEHAGIRRTARMRLLTVLPTVRHSDLASLKPDMRSLLYDQLATDAVLRMPDLAAALLDLIEREGEADALPAVLHLARTPPATSALRCLSARARETVMTLERRAAAAAAAGMETPVTREAMQQAQATALAPAAPPEPNASSSTVPAMRLPFLLAVYFIAMPGLAYLALEWGRQGAIAGTALSVLGMVLAPLLQRYAVLPRHRSALRELEHTTDIRDIGRLAEALGWPEERDRRRIARAIIPLLYRLRASDVRLLDDAQRDNLHAVLRMDRARRDAELQVAILAALEQVGDSRALPFVRALAEARATTARQQRVKQAAISCLEALSTTAERADREKMLLRAATPPTSPETGLVIPAGTSDTPPERLVRPAG